jgi:hypothetical protein
MRVSTQEVGHFESPPRVLDQEYCLARPQFGTVKLFNPDGLKSNVDSNEELSDAISLASNNGQNLAFVQAAG